MASPRLDQPWDSMDIVPEEVESISEIKIPWIHEEVRKVATTGNIDSFPGLTISPIVKVESGIRQYVHDLPPKN